MTFEFAISADAPNAHQPPAWCADVNIAVKIAQGETPDADESIEAEAVCLGGKFGDLIIWPSTWQATYPHRIGKNEGSITARVPLTRELVRAIEVKRAGNGPLQLELSIMLKYRRVLKSGPEYNAPAMATRSETASYTLHWQIHRDPWRTCLKRLGWNEIEIFELPTGPAWNDARLSDALNSLHGAEHLLHFGGDPKAVLGKCFDALESAARYAVQGEDKKKGFALLLGTAFPSDEEKSSQVDQIIKTLNSFAHFGRHADYPAKHVSWTEARFVLVTTLALFELLTSNGR